MYRRRDVDSLASKNSGKTINEQSSRIVGGGPFLEERTQHLSPFFSSFEPATLINRANEALQVTEVVLERRFVFLAGAFDNFSQWHGIAIVLGNQAFGCIH